jgi:hypothetical protein
VTAACASITGGGSPSCASTTLSPTATQIAAGTESTGNTSYTVLLNFTLADAWSFLPKTSCALTVSYQLTGN